MKGQLLLTVVPQPFGKVVLRVEGSVDLATLKPFEAAFLDFDKQKIRYIVVDMAQLTYMASSGFGILIKAKADREPMPTSRAPPWKGTAAPPPTAASCLRRRYRRSV